MTRPYEYTVTGRDLVASGPATTQDAALLAAARLIAFLFGIPRGGRAVYRYTVARPDRTPATDGRWTPAQARAYLRSKGR